MKQIIQALDDTINKSIIKTFNQYIETLSFNDTWIILSDYCVNAANKKNDVMSFVILPYVEDVNITLETIKKNIPCEIKHTRKISNSIINTLNNPFIFSFTFIIDKKFIINQYERESYLEFSNTIISMIENWLQNEPIKGNPHLEEHNNELIKKITRFKEQISKKSWNKKLSKNILLLSHLIAYIICLINRTNNKSNNIAWLSDRDDMTTAYNSIIFDLVEIFTHTISEEYGTPKSKLLGIGDCTNYAIVNGLWYDEGIKLPDYICGVVADLDLKKNQVTHQKYCDLCDNVLAKNNNIIIIRLGENDVARVKVVPKQP